MCIFSVRSGEFDLENCCYMHCNTFIWRKMCDEWGGRGDCVVIFTIHWCNTTGGVTSNHNMNELFVMIYFKVLLNEYTHVDIC